MPFSVRESVSRVVRARQLPAYAIPSQRTLNKMPTDTDHADTDNAMASRQPTVLIVEDDAVFRRVISFTVARAGFNVAHATNGLEGYDRFMVGDINFIVTDLQMPRSNGIEMLERISRQTTVPRVPTILCTAKGLELDTEAIVQHFGLVTVLRKPFSPRHLTEWICDALLVTRVTSHV